MVDSPSKSSEYRREAAACLEAPERMSVRDDCALMLEMAQRWLQLAQEAEADEQ
jgi:putative IMPACT (imprinted ancient) family translation regulator